jgi:hypothetical protein
MNIDAINNNLRDTKSIINSLPSKYNDDDNHSSKNTAAAAANDDDDDDKNHGSCSVDNASRSISSRTGQHSIDFSRSHSREISSSSHQTFALAHHETKAVYRSKLLVLVVIVLAAAAFCTATYIFTHNVEHNDFQQQV